jgi:hypothetical protein
MDVVRNIMKGSRFHELLTIEQPEFGSEDTSSMGSRQGTDEVVPVLNLLNTML